MSQENHQPDCKVNAFRANVFENTYKCKLDVSHQSEHCDWLGTLRHNLDLVFSRTRALDIY